MSKLTTRGNRRIAATIDVMTTNQRTIGATKAVPPAASGLKSKSKVDKSKPVSARNIGTRVAKKTQAKTKK